MNPGSSESSGLNLPPPVGEIAPPTAGGAENQLPGAEKGPATPEKNTQAGQTAAAGLPIIPVPLPSSPPPAATTSGKASNNTAAGSASLTDDADLIEKEWVEKAKAIVERTRDNPYQQSQELTVVKADYMKQRYDKTVKVST